MKDFLVSYWFVILISIIFVGYIIFLIVNRKWTKIRKIAYKLIKQAEETIVGTKKGQERFEQVLTQVYSLLPGWLRLFISCSLMEQKLQEWFDLIKDSLDDGKINNSIKSSDITDK
jgi:hypothetical protein